MDKAMQEVLRVLKPGGIYILSDTGNCAIKDDMAGIMEKMSACDVMVLASPVYFYSIDAQLKAVIDRS